MPFLRDAMLSTTIYRLIKGQFMGMMFMVFGAGILFEQIFILPFLLVYERIAGPDPRRIQGVHRFLFTIWLRLLKAGGLLKTLPSKGKVMDGPCIIVANHPGLFDIIVLIRDIPKMSVLAKSDLRSQLGLGPIFRLSGYVFEPGRSDAFEAMEPVKIAMDLLRQGFKFMLFPEGTRSPKGGMLPFSAGAFKLSRKANVPVQPVLIRNIPPFLSHEDQWYNPPQETSTIELEFLEPIPPPKEGKEQAEAVKLENHYRKILGYGGQ